MSFLKTAPVTYKFLASRARKLQTGWANSGGRNTSGRITSYKKGSFKFKRIYRFIDFWRRLNADAFVVGFEKDNFRSATVALIFYQTGYLSYVILPEGFKIGDKLLLSVTSTITSSTFAANLPSGLGVPLSRVADGSLVFNVELWPLKGAQLARAAGTYAVIVSRRNGFVTLKLRSGWKMVVSDKCYATTGVAPNYKHVYSVLRKAGTRVNLGRRPTTRGVAMNAIDHPHGGGRGKTSGGRCSRTPWGAVTKQRKTVLRKVRQLRRSIRFR